MIILVVSPHPDDETLGAGGTLLKAKQSGHEICWLNVTNMKSEYGFSDEQITQRQGEIQAVNNYYRYDRFIDLALPPAGLEKIYIGDLITKFKTVLDDIKPNVLLLPYHYDVHSDHRIVFEAMCSCTKFFRAPYLKTIMSMEIISETDNAQSDNTFSPNIYIDISDYIDEKIEIMKLYKSEIKEAPFPRNTEAIRGLAALRGATGYYKYAEAFHLINKRIDQINSI